MGQSFMGGHKSCRARIVSTDIISIRFQILTDAIAYCKKWVLAYRAKRQGDTATLKKLLGELTAGFVAVTDMPPLDFIPELMDIYPEAKVVLTTRDPDRWLESIKPVAANSSQAWLPYMMFPIPGWRWFPSLSLEFGRSTQLILDDGDQAANPKPSTREHKSSTTSIAH